MLGSLTSGVKPLKVSKYFYRTPTYAPFHMKKYLPFLIIIILILVGILVYQNFIEKEGENLSEEKISKEEKIPMPKRSLENKKIAMIVAFRDFRDVEYFIPRDVFVQAGARVITFSKEKGRAIGADGGEVEIDSTLEELNPAHYDAVVFVGGSGMAKNIDSELHHQIARATVEANKVLGAICIAPAILAKAGVLDGKKATVWSSPMDKSAVRILQEEGAVYEDKAVVVDGKIVTGNGPMAAKEFAETVVNLLTP